MSDDLRRELARRAGQGDLEAARRLVRLLEREQNAAVLPANTKLADLHAEAWEDLRNRRGAALSVIARALGRDRGEVTLRDVASLSEDDLSRIRTCGRITLRAIKLVLDKGGLTLSSPRSSPWPE